MIFSRLPKVVERWAPAVLITLVTLFTYAPLINQLGFYRDDWYLLWTYEAEGARGLLNLFVGDRPFVGWDLRFRFSFAGQSAFGMAYLCLAPEDRFGTGFTLVDQGDMAPAKGRRCVPCPVICRLSGFLSTTQRVDV